jgi:peptidoglycan/LPS O-acetylase OafA/YrhL
VSRPRARLAALDGLRLVAALAVLSYHYTVAWRIDGVRLPEYFLPRTVHVTIYGFLGVELFMRLEQGRPSLMTILVNLTMLQQPLGHDPVDGVYWTLFVELKFYLIMAVVLGRGLTYRRAVLLCAVWMTAAVLAPSLQSPVLDALTISDYAPYFIGGIALYLIHRFGPTPLLYGITGLSWLVSLSRVEDRLKGMNPGFEVPTWPGALIITLCYVVLLLIALGRADRIRWRWLSVAGALTYPLYLLHARIGHTVIRAAYEHTRAPVWTIVAGTTVLVLGLAWLVHRYVERPLGRRLRDAVRTPQLDWEPIPQRAPVRERASV